MLSRRSERFCRCSLLAALSSLPLTLSAVAGAQEAEPVAGHNKHFFLQSADGNYRLQLAGHLQVRYIYDIRQDSGGDDKLGGFQIRRIKLQGEGHVFTPRLSFEFALAGERGSPETLFEDYFLEYELTDALSVRAGRWKQPFALQDLRSSSRQLAVERASVHELFNVDRSEGLMLTYRLAPLTFYAAVNDGIDGQATDFYDDNTDFATTDRIEWLLAGDPGQFQDASSWSGTGPAAMLGAAIHYQIGETGAEEPQPDILLYTADLSLKAAGVGALIAFYGDHINNEGDADFSDMGLLGEAGYMVIPDTLEPYVRYELILQDDTRPGVVAGASDESTSIITVGFNWYQHKHDAKFTLDAVYGLNPLTGDLVGSGAGVSGGLGLRPDAAGQDGQLSIRAQYQLKW